MNMAMKPDKDADNDNDLGVEMVAEAGNDQFEYVRDYFPDKEDIRQKGRLNKELPYLLSTVEQFTNLFPELRGKIEHKGATENLEDILETWVDDIENRLISVNGKSRKEYEEILSSLVASQQMGTEDKGTIAKLLDAGEDKE